METSDSADLLWENYLHLTPVVGLARCPPLILIFNMIKDSLNWKSVYRWTNTNAHVYFPAVGVRGGGEDTVFVDEVVTLRRQDEDLRDHPAGDRSEKQR